MTKPKAKPATDDSARVYSPDMEGLTSQLMDQNLRLTEAILKLLPQRKPVVKKRRATRRKG